MKLLTRLIAIGLIAGFASAALAADLAGERVYYSAGGSCRLIHPSPILSYLPDTGRVEAEIWRRLDYSSLIAAHPAVIFNRSVAYIWANEAKVSCGKAVGFRDINFDAIDRCDCFYNRMLSYLPRR
jgi:hypothetical protein